MTLQFQPFARRPFVVEAVQVTKKNIAEIAAMGVGTLDRTEKGVLYIKVNNRVVKHVDRVYPGYWFTRTDNGEMRCYARPIFNDQYVALDDRAHFALDPYMRPIDGEDKLGDTHTNVFTDPPEDPRSGSRRRRKGKKVKHPRSLEEIQGERQAQIEAGRPREVVEDEVETNVFAHPPIIEEIPPGKTYTPGRISQPAPTTAKDDHKVDLTRRPDPALVAQSQAAAMAKGEIIAPEDRVDALADGTVKQMAAQGGPPAVEVPEIHDEGDGNHTPKQPDE